MVYVGTYDCYENTKIELKIKVWSTISILKAWHEYKKKMILNFNYVL